MFERALIGAVACVAGVMLLAGPASAHAAYKESDPPDESTVSSPPSSVWAEFTEPVTMDSSLAITDPCGERVDNGDSQVTGARISISMEGRASGTYTVSFSVISAVDGHPTRGAFTFTSTGGEPCPGLEQPTEEEPREETAEKQPSGDRSGPGDESSAAAGPGGPDEPPAGDSGRRGAGTRPGRSPDDDPARRSRREGRPPVAAPPQRPLPPVVEEPGVWDLPMDGFVAALMVAAAIGAVGGRIYAGIISPDA